MKRLGVYTGKIYDSFPVNDEGDALECCIKIPEDKENDKKYLYSLYAIRCKRLLNCYSCGDCPEAKK